MSISKKLRFEVFKRDGFACQYCGKSPPRVMLELDHINPKSKKGKDDINNLITACFDCNRGKGNITLKKVPNSLKINLEILKEKELQLQEYNEFVAIIERRIQEEIQEIDSIYNSYFDGWWLSENFCNSSLKTFLKKLPKNEVAEAMHMACSKMRGKWEPNDRTADSAIKYFCGICWNLIRGNKINVE